MTDGGGGASMEAELILHPTTRRARSSLHQAEQLQTSELSAVLTTAAGVFDEMPKRGKGW
jgi:hypothetical protein